MEKLPASPESSISPAAELSRLQHPSTLVGLRGIINPFFVLPQFVDTARTHLSALSSSFSGDILSDTLEKFLDRYLITADSFLPDDSVSEVSSSPMVDSPTVIHQSRLVPDSLRDILSQSQHKAPVCSSAIPSAIQKFIREHSAYRMFGTRPMHKCIEPLTLLTIQRLFGTLVIRTDDEALVCFLKTNFLPIATFDEVNDHFKNKVYMKSN